MLSTRTPTNIFILIQALTLLRPSHDDGRHPLHYRLYWIYDAHDAHVGDLQLVYASYYAPQDGAVSDAGAGADASLVVMRLARCVI